MDSKGSESALAALMLCGILVCPAPAAAEESGAATFVSQCGVCHVLRPEDGPRQGPHLAGIMGRKAGSIEGFPYSKGLKEAGFEWTVERMAVWLADPQGLIADTYMAYHQDDPAVRAKVVAYLKDLGGQ